MTATGLFFSEPFLRAAGLTLLHSLWQIGLVALVVRLLMPVMLKATANSRYLVASVALIASLLIPLVTFFKIYEPASSIIEEEPVSQGVINLAYTIADSQLQIQSRFELFEQFVVGSAPLVFWFWVVGMMLMSVRMGGGYYLAYRYRRIGVTAATASWQGRVNSLAASMGVRSSVRLLESVKVSVPMVIGLLKPCIIVPVGTLGRLPFDQVEMILAHELAHIKRADFLINFFQSLIEMILFFNPFVWWISALIRRERENICDDMALRTTGGYLSLAKALANLSAALQPAPLANSLITFNQLNTMKRIERLISKPKLKPTTSERIGVIVFSFLFVALITASGWLTGSNSQPAEEELNSEALSLLQEDTLRQVKTIELEKKDNKIVKIVIDGKEVTEEELGEAGFEWKETDSLESKKIIIRSKTTGTPAPAEGVWVNHDGKTVQHKIVTVEPGGRMKIRTKVLQGGEGADSVVMEFDNVMMFNDSLFELNGDKMRMISFPEGKAVFFNGEVEAPEFDFDFTFDEEYVEGMEADGRKHIIVRGHDMQREMEHQRREMQQQAEQMKAQAEQLKLEAEKMDGTDATAAAEIKANAEELKAEADRLDKLAQELSVIPIPPNPPMPEWHEKDVRIFRESDEGEGQYHRLLRKELVRDGIISPRTKVLISRKQLIIDNEVADKKTHRMVLRRFEDILGRKLDAGEAVSLGL